MNPLTIISSSFHVLLRNAANIALLCLPLLVVEMFVRNIIRSQLGIDTSWIYQALIGTVLPPIYTGLLILLLDARSRGERPAKAQWLSRTLRLWPALALLSGIDQLLLVVANLSFIPADTWTKLILSTVIFVPPGVWVALKWAVFFFALWVMMRLMFNQCLVVLRGSTPMAAIRESIALSQGQLWRVVGCLLVLLIPVLVITAIVSSLLTDWVADIIFAFQQNSPGSVMAYSIIAGFIRLFTTIVVFRFFTLISEQSNKQTSATTLAL